MSSSMLKNDVEITFIGTATAIIKIDNVTFLTDPFFSPAGTEWPSLPGHPNLKVHDDPALDMSELPHIDAVLLSHENHPDNLDELGRTLLNGRHVFTTRDGAHKLAPRPSVHGFADWEEKHVTIAGIMYQIIATPCQHWPGHECVGFLLHTPSFGSTPDGRPNVLYFSGDTVYIPELAQIKQRYNVVIAIMNCGQATFLDTDSEGLPDHEGESLQITMGGTQAVRLFKDIGADVLVPMHFESWDHFKQGKEGLAREFEEEGVLGSVRWLVPGRAVKF
ncbi:beta-lactamase superfamily domain-containing protein [Boeremia exigua]|uniref:beta-lactamase superfamily domain-containing protein n=1 Tax=Boeremia exigua TaxID=749465 RepID=UPI001E8D8D46|nr:beta-lactamase superfamily domain-containing protein [Boeremia exigua]KAH6616295.1 beta-lactamase superfamily domain-containing protein [Boeremia exigua]